MAETIKDKAEKAGHKIAEKATEVGHKVGETAEAAKDWAKETAHKVGNRIEETVQKAEHKVKEMFGEGGSMHGICREHSRAHGRLRLVRKQARPRRSRSGQRRSS